MGIIRDYDNQKGAKDKHDKLDDGKSICVRTTSEYTLEPEIVKTGNNYSILQKKYGDTFGWKSMSVEQMQQAWRDAKAADIKVNPFVKTNFSEILRWVPSACHWTFSAA